MIAPTSVSLLWIPDESRPPKKKKLRRIERKTGPQILLPTERNFTHANKYRGS